jgi:hypothetical protein
MANYVSTSKDVLSARTGPKNAQEAIAAQANAKRAAANTGTGSTRSSKGVAYGGGPLTQDLNKFSPARGGTMGTGAAAPPAPMGYDPGSFNDPTIDWNAIYEIFIAGPQREAAAASGGGGGAPSGGGGSMPAQVAPPTPMVMESPASIMAPSIQQPAAVNSAASSIANAPEGQKFQTFGSPSTFGGFERMRNQRGPRNNASMTPEMLRRAAASRLG